MKDDCVTVKITALHELLVRGQCTCACPRACTCVHACEGMCVFASAHDARVYIMCSGLTLHISAVGIPRNPVEHVATTTS